ncbi:hypothetical protein D3C80_1946920 [compost metagenome]
MGDFGINIPTIPMLAKGTDYFNGGTAIVGERGAEMVNLPRGSQVVPHKETMDILSNQGSPEYIQVSIQLDSREIAKATSKAQYSNNTSRSRGLGLA